MKKQQSEGEECGEAKIQKQKNETFRSGQVVAKNLQRVLSSEGKSKAQMVRQIQLQIQLLEAKSKQPGTRSNDLQPLGHEIYEKIDQYYIQHGVYKNRLKQLQITNNFFLNKLKYEHKQELSEKVKKSTPRSPSALSDVSTINNKAHQSRFAATQEQEVFESRKVFKTCQDMDFSVSSISQKSNNLEEMPFFQTKMSESDLAALDKPFKQLEAEAEGMNEDYFELKENIRVMEERIVFLIHRLDQTKTELSEAKEEVSELHEKLKKQSNMVKQLKNQQEMFSMLHEKDIEEIEAMQKTIQELRSKMNELENVLSFQQRQNNQLKAQIECLQIQVAERQRKTVKIETSLKLKVQECNQLTVSYRLFQEEVESYKKQVLKKIEEKEAQNSKLQKILKEYRSRVQTQGLSFRFEEAHKLKQLIQDSSAFHEQQLRKTEKEYTNIIESLKVELENTIYSKKELQNALAQYLGLRESSAFSKNTTLVQSKCLSEAEGKELAFQFVEFVNKFKEFEREVQTQKELIVKYEDRIEILKQDSQEKFMANKQLGDILEKKKTQIEQLTRENEELKKYLRQNLSNNIRKRKKENEQNNATPSLRKSKIQSRIIEISLAKPIVSDHSELTLQSFIRKKVLVIPSEIIRFIIKLISFSEQLQDSHKKKLPSIAPHSVLLSVKKLKDLDIVFSIVSKKQQEQGLIYQAPQILLGFSESAQSHCWTIGVIFDEMLHGRKFFKSFGDILSHKDNYLIQDEKFKSVEMLCEMIRKNHKQRKSLSQVKSQLQHLLYVLNQK